MPDPGDASSALAAVLFLAAAAVIGVVGTRLTGVADTLAERAGLGEALVGAVLLGVSTSLSGIVTSVTAAAAARHWRMPKYVSSTATPHRARRSCCGARRR